MKNPPTLQPQLPIGNLKKRQRNFYLTGLTFASLQNYAKDFGFEKVSQLLNALGEARFVLIARDEYEQLQQIKRIVNLLQLAIEQDGGEISPTTILKLSKSLDGSTSIDAFPLDVSTSRQLIF